MPKRKWTNQTIAGFQESRVLAGTLGTELRRSRKRKRMTQRDLGARIGLTDGWISDLERGFVADAPLSTWVTLGFVIGRPLAVGFSRDIAERGEPRDAGHLAAQELVLRLARAHGRRTNVEMATRPSDPA